MRYPNYMYRILVIALLIGIIPVIIVGFVSFWIASKDIEDRVKQSNIQILKQDQLRVEQMIMNLEASALQYAGSSLVLEAIRGEISHKDYRQIWDLSKGLYTLQANDGIKEVYLIHFKDNWIIRNNGFYELNQFEHAEQLKNAAAQNPKKMFWVFADNPLSSDTVNLIVKLPLYLNSNNADGILVIEMFRNDLFRSLFEDQPGHAIVLDAEYEPIVAGPGQLAADTDELRPLLDSANGFVGARVNGQDWGIAYIRSSYNDLIYMSFESMTEIKQQTSKITDITIITCLSLFLLVAVFSYYGSRRLYSPIKRLFEYLGGEQYRDAKDKSHNEFSVIEERFKTMFHSEKKLQLQVKEQFPRMRELLVLQLFMDHYSPEDWLYKCRMLGFSVHWKYYAVIVLQIDTLTDSKYKATDRDLLLYAINNIAEDIIQDTNWFKPILLDQSQVSIVYCDKPTLEEANAYFYDIAKQLKANVAQYLSVQVSIGISNTFDQITDAKRAYKEGLQAIQSRFVLGNDIILHYDDLRYNLEFDNKAYIELKALENQVLQAFKPADQPRVEEAFQKYLDAITHKQIGFKEYQILMRQLLSKIFELIQEHGVPITEVFDPSVIQDEWKQLNQTEEIRKWFGDFVFAPVITFLHNREQSKFANVAGEMLKIVRDHYDRDLSLEMCGDLLNYHPVYLSRVFKKQIGMNFTEYVAQSRMDQAKIWLEQTDMMVSEIAEKLSYNNTTAFIRTFRKVVGETPGKYRTEHKKNE
ncbi:helix-turn-helix domain-containing protein [Paenibacillus agaridevorans]|uniref:helix-turn-helix domain-containing protein n=1 Tax=Paenibacillus agaridevorans TaxID=171404 RepID=UPI001BE4BD86|nr:helix-turn-helix domain-containing protein [Paenibacillus agaridevorans]